MFRNEAAASKFILTMKIAIELLVLWLHGGYVLSSMVAGTKREAWEVSEILQFRTWRSRQSRATYIGMGTHKFKLMSV